MMMVTVTIIIMTMKSSGLGPLRTVPLEDTPDLFTLFQSLQITVSALMILESQYWEVLFLLQVSSISLGTG